MPRIPIPTDGRSTRWGSALQRFEKGFSRGLATECWLWTGRTDKFGYGQVKDFGRTLKTHRLSYQTYVGEIPEGLCVLHSCDVPACVNPNHLFLGTKLDNTKDMIAKGRDNFKGGTGAISPLVGEDNPGSKLTEAQVIEILQWSGNRWSPGERLSEMAARMSVTIQTLDRIRAGTLWKHLYHHRRK